jgi:hypothetical protein
VKQGRQRKTGNRPPVFSAAAGPGGATVETAAVGLNAFFSSSADHFDEPWLH